MISRSLSVTAEADPAVEHEGACAGVHHGNCYSREPVRTYCNEIVVTYMKFQCLFCSSLYVLGVQYCIASPGAIYTITCRQINAEGHGSMGNTARELCTNSGNI